MEGVTTAEWRMVGAVAVATLSVAWYGRGLVGKLYSAIQGLRAQIVKLETSVEATNGRVLKLEESVMYADVSKAQHDQSAQAIARIERELDRLVKSCSYCRSSGRSS